LPNERLVSDEELHAKLIVPDTGPLITLAAADGLDYLLYPGAPIYVPDAVLYEATVKSDALGAQSIAEWVQRHSQQVHSLVTQVFADYLAALEAGLRAPRDLGERAAIEAIRHTLVLAKGSAPSLSLKTIVCSLAPTSFWMWTAIA
jgi:hypothetical protein